MDSLIIFGAKYLFLLSGILYAVIFYRSDDETRKRLAVFSIISLPLTYILGLIGRALWFNPRPFVTKNLPPLIEHAPDNGFPSDHTLLLASLASLVWYFDRRASAMLWAITLLVGFSRVLAYVHHFADVIGSIAIALASAAIVHFVLERQKKL